jgi:hypothetical protein
MGLKHARPGRANNNQMERKKRLKLSTYTLARDGSK